MSNVSLIYPNGKEALKNINLKINEGEFVAVIGLSGAGKTTLLKTINKLSDITSGEIYVGDRDENVINDYYKLKEKFLHEVEKRNNFKHFPILTEEIVLSLAKDLNKEIVDRNEQIISFINQREILNDEIKKIEEKINLTRKEINSGFLVKPFEMEINKKQKEIKKISQEISNKSKKFEIVKAFNESLIEKICDWENNNDEIVKNLNLRLDKRVKHFRKVYQEAKRDKPYFEVHKLKGKKAQQYKTHIGMVFQRYSLIYKSSVFNNTLSGRLAKMPWWRAVTGFWSKEDKERAFQALADVNMLEAAYARAEDLSGGQMQRVALSRTIAQEARIILADEPVGALDPIMAKSVMDSFLNINQKLGKTILINLHHVDLALTYTNRIIGVSDGKIVFDGPVQKVNVEVLKQIYGDQLEGFDEHELREIKRKRSLIQKHELTQ